MLSVISLAVFGGLISLINGACFVKPNRFYPIPETSVNEEIFCEYRGYKYRNGSSFLTPDCYDCSCSTEALNCCGFGPHLTHGVLPSWCEWWAIGCELKAVLKGFPRVECPYTDDTPRPWKEPIPELLPSEDM